MKGDLPMSTKRIYFLDNLKSFIILLMVFFHAAMSYMAYPPDWWYVSNTEHVLAGTVFVLWADTFIMPVMFFISGYFGQMSLAHHSFSSFLKSKLLRIALPWLFGAMLIAPYIAYLMIASRSIPLSFSDFYLKLFWGAAYQQAHYWYLGALLALYGLLMLFTALFPGCRKAAAPKDPHPLLFLFLLLFSTLSFGGLTSILPDGTWIHPLYILMLQPTRVPLYLCYFFLGSWAWQKQWFTAKGYQPSASSWSALFLLASLCYLLVRLIPALLPLPAVLLPYGNAFFHGLLCMSAVFALCALFQHFLDYTTKRLAIWAMVSYPIYYLHQIFLQHSIWLFRPLALNIWCKYLLATCLALTVTFLASRYLLLRLPCFAPSAAQKKQPK